MTTPIMRVLAIAQQPPYIVGWQELDKFIREITALYEQQAKGEREAFLLDDFTSLLFRHRMAIIDGKNIENSSPTRLFPGRNDKDLKNIQSSIEEIARYLLSVANSLNTRLPESFMDQCKNSTDNGVMRFYEIINEAYVTPEWKKDIKADGKPTGTTGNQTDSKPGKGTNKPQSDNGTPPQPKDPDPENIFNDCIADEFRPYAQIIRDGLKTVLDGKTATETIIAFAACFVEPHKILRYCPNHEQALIVNNAKHPGTENYVIGKHGGYNNAKKDLFKKEENGKYYNELKSEESKYYREDILKAERELKALFESLGVLDQLQATPTN